MNAKNRNLPLYSIRDMRVSGFNPPFVSANDYTAVLAVREQMLSNKNDFLNLADADLCLCRLGYVSLNDGCVFSDFEVVSHLDEIFDFDVPEKPEKKEVALESKEDVADETV